MDVMVPSWHGPDCPPVVVIVGDRAVPGGALTPEKYG